jgi:hypothetical protein
MAETFNNSPVKLTTTAVTDAYQAPNAAEADRSVVLSCMVANVNGTSAAEITLTLTSSADAELSKIANTITVPADSAIELIPNKLILKRGQKLRATASQANALDVTISVLEITA